LKTKRLWLLIGSICLALVLALPLVVACAGPAPTPTPTPTPEEKVLLLGGCGVGGSFYALATALMKVINEKVPDYRAIAQVTGCSVENCRLLNERKVYNAQASVGVASDAYAGTGSFDSPIPLAVTNYSFTAYTWFLTLDDSIKSIQDLKGKRVSMGDPGGGTAVVISGVLKALGITEADFTPIYLNESAAAGALRDGSIDVFALVGGTQQASITEVTTVEDVHFISLTKEEAEKGAAAVKGRLPISITKGVYKGMDEDLWSVGGVMLFAVHPDEDADSVYTITKAMWENMDIMEATHASAKEFNINQSGEIDCGIPFHPGAIKYYKEVGVWKK